ACRCTFSPIYASIVLLCVFSHHGLLRVLPSFPTRRSSDLFIVVVLFKLLFFLNLLQIVFLPFFECNFNFVNLFFIRHRVSKTLRSEEHTSELQSRFDLVCRLLLEKKKSAIFYMSQLM